MASPSTFDEARCRELCGRARSTADPAWRELIGLLWPELERQLLAGKTLRGLGRSDDHARNVAVLVLEKLGRDHCRALGLYETWAAARPEKTFGDWLRIVVTNTARDYLRERKGRAARTEEAAAGGAIDKRLLHSLAALLPDEDDLPAASALSQSSSYAAKQLLAWAEGHLSEDQREALRLWLAGDSFEEMASSLGVADAAASKRVLRAAVATLRRHVAEA